MTMNEQHLDLSFLSREEAQAVLEVLARDKRLKKIEEERMGRLFQRGEAGRGLKVVSTLWLQSVGKTQPSSSQPSKPPPRINVHMNTDQLSTIRNTDNPTERHTRQSTPQTRFSSFFSFRVPQRIKGDLGDLDSGNSCQQQGRGYGDSSEDESIQSKQGNQNREADWPDIGLKVELSPGLAHRRDNKREGPETPRGTITAPESANALSERKKDLTSLPVYEEHDPSTVKLRSSMSPRDQEADTTVTATLTQSTATLTQTTATLSQATVKENTVKPSEISTAESTKSPGERNEGTDCYQDICGSEVQLDTFVPVKTHSNNERSKSLLPPPLPGANSPNPMESCIPSIAVMSSALAKPLAPCLAVGLMRQEQNIVRKGTSKEGAFLKDHSLFSEECPTGTSLPFPGLQKQTIKDTRHSVAQHRSMVKTMSSLQDHHDNNMSSQASCNRDDSVLLSSNLMTSGSLLLHLRRLNSYTGTIPSSPKNSPNNIRVKTQKPQPLSHSPSDSNIEGPKPHPFTNSPNNIAVEKQEPHRLSNSPSYSKMQRPEPLMPMTFPNDTAVEPPHLVNSPTQTTSDSTTEPVEPQSSSNTHGNIAESTHTNRTPGLSTVHPTTGIRRQIQTTCRQHPTIPTRSMSLSRLWSVESPKTFSVLRQSSSTKEAPSLILGASDLDAQGRGQLQSSTANRERLVAWRCHFSQSHPTLHLIHSAPHVGQYPSWTRLDAKLSSRVDFGSRFNSYSNHPATQTQAYRAKSHDQLFTKAVTTGDDSSLCPYTTPSHTRWMSSSERINILAKQHTWAARSQGLRRADSQWENSQLSSYVLPNHRGAFRPRFQQQVPISTNVCRQESSLGFRDLKRTQSLQHSDLQSENTVKTQQRLRPAYRLSQSQKSSVTGSFNNQSQQSTDTVNHHNQSQWGTDTGRIRFEAPGTLPGQNLSRDGHRPVSAACSPGFAAVSEWADRVHATGMARFESSENSAQPVRHRPYRNLETNAPTDMPYNQFHQNTITTNSLIQSKHSPTENGKNVKDSQNDTLCTQNALEGNVVDKSISEKIENKAHANLAPVKTHKRGLFSFRGRKDSLGQESLEGIPISVMPRKDSTWHRGSSIVDQMLSRLRLTFRSKHREDKSLLFGRKDRTILGTKTSSLGRSSDITENSRTEKGKVVVEDVLKPSGLESNIVYERLEQDYSNTARSYFSTENHRDTPSIVSNLRNGNPHQLREDSSMEYQTFGFRNQATVKGPVVSSIGSGRSQISLDIYPEDTDKDVFYDPLDQDGKSDSDKSSSVFELEDAQGGHGRKNLPLSNIAHDIQHQSSPNFSLKHGRSVSVTNIYTNRTTSHRRISTGNRMATVGDLRDVGDHGSPLASCSKALSRSFDQGQIKRSLTTGRIWSPNNLATTYSLRVAEPLLAISSLEMSQISSTLAVSNKTHWVNRSSMRHMSFGGSQSSLLVSEVSDSDTTTDGEYYLSSDDGEKESRL